jgi:hypothetical protein
MDSIIELFNRAGAFLDQQLKKEGKDKDNKKPGPKRFEFVEKSFAILEKYGKKHKGRQSNCALI